MPEWRCGGPGAPILAGGPGAGELPLPPPPGVQDRAVDAMCSHHAGTAAAGDFGGAAGAAGAAGFCGVPAAGLGPGDCACA